MNTENYLSFVRIPHAPVGQDAEWNSWYDNTHIPARLELSGFERARRFRSLYGESDYVTLYEISDPEVLETPEYKSLREVEAQLPASSFESWTTASNGVVRDFYERMGSVQRLRDFMEITTLFTVGHNIPQGREEEFNAWYETEHIPSMLLHVPGFLSVDRFRLLESRRPQTADLRTTHPEYITLYEVADETALQCEEFAEWRNSAWSSWVRSWYSREFRILAKSVGKQHVK
jgi:hypothetical protein